MNEPKLIYKGLKGAMLLVCDTDKKYELVSAYCYDDKTNTWGQGHYFTLWYDEITLENKVKLFNECKKHFMENYL